MEIISSQRNAAKEEEREKQLENNKMSLVIPYT